MSILIININQVLKSPRDSSAHIHRNVEKSRKEKKDNKSHCSKLLLKWPKNDGLFNTRHTTFLIGP